MRNNKSKLKRNSRIMDRRLYNSEIWTKVKLFVGGSFLVINLTACGQTNEDANASSVVPASASESVVPSSSEESASSEVTQASEAQSTETTESTEVVESAEKVIENPITAEEAHAIVTDLSNTFAKTAYAKYIPTIYFAINYDKFTDEERENYQSLFAITDEDLDANYVEFMHLQQEILNNIYNYSTGGNIDKKYTMDDIIKIENFLTDDKDKETAREFDNYITEFLNTGRSPKKYINESRDLETSDYSTSLDMFTHDYIFSSFTSRVPKKAFFR